MYVLLRRIIIRLFLPITWRLFKRRPAHALLDFAATEADSGWQFLRAIERLPNAEHRAMLFHNVLEEKEHASEFQALVDGLPGGDAERPSAARNALIDDDENLAAFLAYVYAGELDISQEFSAYAKAVPVPAAQRLFDQIQEDEDGHQDSLWETLITETGDRKEADRLVKKARRRRMWRAWMKFWKRVGDRFMGLWLTLVYAIFGLLLLVAARRRMSEGSLRS